MYRFPDAISKGRGFLLDRFNFLNLVRAVNEFGRPSKLEPYQLSVSKLRRFPIKLGNEFTSLHNRSRAFKSIKFLILSGRVEIFVLERFNSCDFIRALIESRRLSSLEYCKSSLSNITKFPIKLERDFTSLHDRLRAFKCINFSMLHGRVEIFVLDRFNSYNFIRALIESGRLSNLEPHK